MSWSRAWAAEATRSDCSMTSSARSRFEWSVSKPAAAARHSGITRRGFGESGFVPPTSGGDTYGDDVLAVLDANAGDLAVVNLGEKVAEGDGLRARVVRIELIDREEHQDQKAPQEERLVRLLHGVT